MRTLDPPLATTHKDADGPCRTFPRLLRRIWATCDPATRTMRTSDALGYTTPHLRFPTHDGDYWLCEVTGQLQRDQFVAAPAEHYDAHWQPQLGDERDTVSDVAHWRHHLRRYEKYRRTGRLLEVASGQGRLLRAAVELGWDATGNDVSPIVAEHAQKFSGAPFLVAPIEQVQLPDDHYDIVILNNIFEHLESPMAVLRQLTRALRPGGIIFLQTLNSQSLSLWHLGPEWYYFHSGHLYVPSHLSMQQYFRRAKLEPRSRSTHGFRSGSTKKVAPRTFWRKRFDQWMGNLASLTHTGTRVRYVLQKPESA